MDSQLSERDAFRVQVAAVVAQQAAVTEQEIRLETAREQFVGEQRSLIADVESLILHILAEEEHIERRQGALASREAFIERLENACSRLARELDLAQHTLTGEDAPALPRSRAA